MLKRVLVASFAVVASLVVGSGEAKAQSIAGGAGLLAPLSGETYFGHPVTGSCPVNFDASGMMWVQVTGPSSGTWSWSFSIMAYKNGTPPAIAPFPDTDHTAASGSAPISLGAGAKSPIMRPDNTPEPGSPELTGRAGYTAPKGSSPYTGKGVAKTTATAPNAPTALNEVAEVLFMVKPAPKQN